MPAVLNPRPKLAGADAHRPRPWQILLTACCGVFVSFGSLFIFTFGIFLKPLAAAFGWSRAEVSTGFTAAVLAVAVCSPVIGRLLDRFPARRIVIPCLIVYAAGLASLSLLTAHLWHFVLVVGALGVVGNGTTQLGYARVVSAWFDESRGRALAAVMAGSGIGSMVFPPLAQMLISLYGWRFAYVVLGGIVLVLGLPLVTAFLYEPESQKAAQRSTSTVVRHGITRDVFSFRFAAIAGALLLFSLATNGLNTHWAALLTDRGLAPGVAAAVLSAAGLATLGSKLSTGFLLDRFLGNRAVAVLFSVSAAGLLVILYARSTASAFAAAIMVGIGMGAESDAVPFLLTRYFGLQRFSELYGYTWSVYALGGGLGPMLAGSIFDHTGSYRIALGLFVPMTAAAAGLFAILPAYQRHESGISAANLRP